MQTPLPQAPETASWRARASFRAAGRRVLREPARREAHWQRVQAALALPGSEPVQGALVDMLHACPPDAADFETKWQQLGVARRLAPLTAKSLHQAGRSGQALPRISRYATRWCVLAAPALDGPRRALLCGADDSRNMAATALRAIGSRDTSEEQHFLAHCEGAHDALAFMLARRALLRQGIEPGPEWMRVFAFLQGEKE